MSNPKFHNLIEELRTDLIIFIDDDFTPITDAGILLFYVTTLNQIDYELIVPKIQQINLQTAELINQFKQAIGAIQTNAEDKEWFEAGQIVQRLNDIQQNDLSAQAREICNRIAEQPDSFATLIMTYGLAPISGAVTCYKPFIETINTFSTKKSVRIYKSLEGDNYNEFEVEIRNVLQRLDNKYFLLIVDKILANNQDGNSIISDLRDRDNNINTFFSVLFTSRLIDPPNQATNIQSYFHFEIQKPEQEGDIAIEKVSQGLALCAYAVFFNALFQLRESALKEANSLAMGSGKDNMLYLADMAHAEGATVFRTIDNWFELLVQKKISDRLAQKTGDTLDFDFIVGLTSLINSNFLPNVANQPSQQFKSEIQQLSSYELFDYSINNLYTPPNPGDIFQIKDDLYILTGQDCDLIVRSDGTGVARKEKLAEMVKCTFHKTPLDDKKKEDERSLSLNYFYHAESYGTLEIEFNKRIFFDFKLLDLCSTNKNGNSVFKIGESLSKAATKALPMMWSKYYPKLIEEIQEKIKIHKFINDEGINREILASDRSFLIDFEETDNTISFPLKRTSRLKGQFKDYFLNKYWEYKTRKGLNTISLYNRKQITVETFKYGFSSNKTESAEKLTAWLQLTGNRDKNKNLGKLPLIVNKQAILPLILEPHKSIFNAIVTDEIILNQGQFQYSELVFVKEYAADKFTLDISIPYYNSITQKYFKSKEKLRFTEIFTPDFDQQPSEDSFYTVLEEDGNHNFFDNGKPCKIPIENLVKGITIPSMNLIIKLDTETGCLNRIEPEQNNVNEQRNIEQ